MLLNFGDFVTSPIGITLGVMLFLGILIVAVLKNRRHNKDRRNTYALHRERVGRELVVEISAALSSAVTENPSLRVRTINTDIRKLVVVDCTAFQPKSYPVIEIEVKPHLVLPITIRRGKSWEQVSQLNPHQLTTLCEAVRNYDPVQALR